MGPTKEEKVKVTEDKNKTNHCFDSNKKPFSPKTYKKKVFTNQQNVLKRDNGAVVNISESDPVNAVSKSDQHQSHKFNFNRR